MEIHKNDALIIKLLQSETENRECDWNEERCHFLAKIDDNIQTLKDQEKVMDAMYDSRQEALSDVATLRQKLKESKSMHGRPENQITNPGHYEMEKSKKMKDDMIANAQSMDEMKEKMKKAEVERMEIIQRIEEVQQSSSIVVEGLKSENASLLNDAQAFEMKVFRLQIQLNRHNMNP